MFLESDLLNDGKVATNVVKRTKTRFSEGKNPKSYLTDVKSSVSKTSKAHACVNANWQKLR